MSEEVHLIQLSFTLTKELGLKSIIIDCNTTNMPSDSELVKKLAFTVLKSIQLNKEDILVQDLLNEIGINITKGG